MLSQELTQALEAQIGHEFSAHNHYLAIAVYFESRSLDGWAAFFFAQAEEERAHAMKIVRFLLDNDVAPRIPEARAAAPDFESALEAVRSALEAERSVTAQFERMMEIALKAQDFRAVPLIEWFLNEQIEEESSMQKLVDLVESGLNLFQAQSFLPARGGEEAGA